MTWVNPATSAAWPPVATTRALPPSSSTIRLTIPSTWATKPQTRPDWIEATVLRPITESGATGSTRPVLEAAAGGLDGGGVEWRPPPRAPAAGAPARREPAQLEGLRELARPPVGGRLAGRGDPPVRGETIPVEQGDRHVRVADVD